MNPYLRIEQPIPPTTYFYAHGILQSKWPEMEPTSSQIPVPRIELLEEIPIGSEHPLLNAQAVFGIYIEDELFGKIQAAKPITINEHGIFQYQSFYDEGFQKFLTSRLSPTLHSAPHFIADVLLPRVIGVYSNWIPPSPSALSAKVEEALIDILLINGQILEITTPRTTEKVTINFAVWPYSFPIQGASPFSLFVVSKEPYYEDHREEPEETTYYTRHEYYTLPSELSVPPSELFFTPEQALSAAYRLLDLDWVDKEAYQYLTELTEIVAEIVDEIEKSRSKS